MEAVAALVPALGAFGPADLLDRAAELRRRQAPRQEDVLPRAARGEPPEDEVVLSGELLDGLAGGQTGAGGRRDADLHGTPLLRDALSHGGLVDGRRAVQSYEAQQQAGYVQELRQATFIDLYV